MANKLTTGFSRLSDGDFDIKAQSIYFSMLNNEHFPTTIPAITEVESAVTAFKDALTAAQSRGKNEVAFKNQCRKVLTDALKQLANSVMATANGDLVMLVSSGFDLSKKGENMVLEKPESIQLFDGKNPGELVVKVPGIRGARTYNFQYTADPVTENSVWQQELSTSCRHTIRKLDSAKRYWCRVAVVGPFGQMVYSDANSRIVQ